MRSPLRTQCITPALGLSTYRLDLVQGVLQEASLQYNVSAPIKHVREGEEEVRVAEDITYSSASEFSSNVSSDVSLPLFCWFSSCL